MQLNIQSLVFYRFNRCPIAVPRALSSKWSLAEEEIPANIQIHLQLGDNEPLPPSTTTTDDDDDVSLASNM